MAREVAGTGASTGAVERVEVVTRGARRSFTPEEKARWLAEATQPGARVLEVARRHGICASLLHRWRRQAEGRPVRKVARRPAQPASFVPLLIDTADPERPPLASAPAAPASPGMADAPIEVVLRNGRVLRVGAGTDAAAVARLAAALDA